MLVVTYEGCGVSEVEAVYPEHGDGGPHGARHQQHRQGDRRVGPPARGGLRGRIMYEESLPAEDLRHAQPDGAAGEQVEGARGSTADHAQQHAVIPAHDMT